MKNLGKIIGRVCLGALAAGLIPYRVKQDKETGTVEVGSLLWAVKKTPGAGRDTYTFELLPLLGGKEAPAENETPVSDASAASAEPAESVGSN